MNPNKDQDQVTHDQDIQADKHEKPPIFIVGGGRSGTTLFRYMMNAHPNIYILEEAGFYLWSEAKKKGNEERRMRRFLNSFSFAWLRIPSEKIFQRFRSSQGDPMKEAFVATMAEKAETYGRSRYGEKNPIYLAFLDKIEQDFPGAPIVNVVRDPRAQVYSHLTMPFSTPSLLIANFLNKLNYGLIKKAKARILNIKLENLVSEPKSVMEKVLEFVDEPWSDRVLNHQQHILEDDGIPFPWLREAARSRKVKKKKWKDNMSPAWIRITESWQKEAFKEYGYKPMELEKEPSRLAKWGAILADIPVAIFSIFWSFIVLLRIAFTRDEKVEKMQQLYHSFNPGAWSYHDGWNKRLPTPPPIK